MTPSSNKTTGKKSRLALVLALASALASAFVLVAIPLACMLQEGQDPQAWEKGHGPVVPHDSFPADCSLCHLSGSWDRIKADFKFDHEKEAGLALEGAHNRAQCLRCHNDRGPVALFFKRGCRGCHEDQHFGQLGRECKSCHSQKSWVPNDQILKHSRTRFPLVGSHSAVACYRCHPGFQVGDFKRAVTSCQTCHQEQLSRATNPDHLAQGWTQNCQTCHTPTSWGGGGFTHGHFPLTGSHSGQECTKCHVGGVYRGTSRLCYSCHAANYNGTTTPNHTAAGFPTTCENCHSTVSFQGANFIHNTWALTGKHNTLACTSCHGGGLYRGTSRLCYSCHATDYNNTTTPPHQGTGFPTTCESCHNTSSFLGASFNHPFPRTGPHANRACVTCHQNPANFKQFTCFACHEHSKTKMDQKHQGKSGYSYSSASCFGCHPQGKKG